MLLLPAYDIRDGHHALNERDVGVEDAKAFVVALGGLGEQADGQDEFKHSMSGPVGKAANAT